LVGCDYNDFNLVAKFFRDTFSNNLSDLRLIIDRLVENGYRYFQFVGDGYGLGQLVVKSMLSKGCIAYSFDPSPAMRVLAGQLGFKVMDARLPPNDLFVDIYFHVDVPVPDGGRFVYYSKNKISTALKSYGNLYVSDAVNVNFWGVPLVFNDYTRSFVPSSNGQLIFCNDDGSRYLADKVFKSSVIYDLSKASVFYFSSPFNIDVPSFHDLTFYYVNGDKRFLIHANKTLDLVGRVLGFNCKSFHWFADSKTFLHDTFIMTCIFNGRKVYLYHHVLQLLPQRRGSSYFVKGAVNSIKPDFPFGLVEDAVRFDFSGRSCSWGYYSHVHRNDCSCNLFVYDVESIRCILRVSRPDNVLLASLSRVVSGLPVVVSNKSGYVQLNTKKKKKVIV